MVPVLVTCCSFGLRAHTGGDLEPKDGNGGFAVDFGLEFVLLSRLGCDGYFGVLRLPFFSPISLGNARSLVRIARRVHTRACLIQETPNTASSFFCKYLIAPWRRLFRYLRKLSGPPHFHTTL
jgi:hypothetical protein